MEPETLDEIIFAIIGIAVVGGIFWWRWYLKAPERIAAAQRLQRQRAERSLKAGIAAVGRRKRLTELLGKLRDLSFCPEPVSFLCGFALAAILLFSFRFRQADRYTVIPMSGGYVLIRYDHVTGQTWQCIPARGEDWKEIKNPPR